MSKRVLQKEISLQNILDAATELFSGQGYDCTSIRQIAEKAGISLGLLYNYFKGKDEVLREIILRGHREYKKALEPQQDLKGLPYLEYHIKATFRALDQHKIFCKLYYSLRLQSEVVKTLEQEVQAENQKLLQALTHHLAEAASTSPSAEALLLTATLDGIAQQYLIQPNYPLQDVLIRYMVQLKNHLKTN
jgi:AcrR family transcriptional regulator